LGKRRTWTKFDGGSHESTFKPLPPRADVPLEVQDAQEMDPMRKLALAAALAVSAIGMSVTANAMPSLQMAPPDSAITQVAQGCGPGGHRTPYGRCVPNYGYRPPLVRGCPPGLRFDRFGHCRRY
jgi:hypothetical protein